MPLGNFEFNRQYVYMQYRGLEWINAYTNMLKDFLDEEYRDFIHDIFIPSLNLRTSENRFIFFYALHYLGLTKPWGQPFPALLYDTDELYDSGGGDEPLRYDEIEVSDGHIGEARFIAYTKFAFNYSQRVLNLDFLVSFVAEYCRIPKIKIRLDLKPGNIKVKMPKTIYSEDFVSLIRSNVNLCGFPMGGLLQFDYLEEEELSALEREIEKMKNKGEDEDVEESSAENLDEANSLHNEEAESEEAESEDAESEEDETKNEGGSNGN